MYIERNLEPSIVDLFFSEKHNSWNMRTLKEKKYIYQGAFIKRILYLIRQNNRFVLETFKCVSVFPSNQSKRIANDFVLSAHACSTISSINSCTEVSMYLMKLQRQLNKDPDSQRAQGYANLLYLFFLCYTERDCRDQ